MRRQIVLFVTLIAAMYCAAQELPTIPANGYAFPLGCRFTIKLYQVDSLNFNYSIISYETYQKTADIFETEKLFPETGADSTISFYFSLGSYGKKKKDRKENMRIVLLLKNYSTYTLSYTSDIQIEENGEFQQTSNVGTFPGVQTSEIWPYMIYMIGLKDFRVYSELPSEINIETYDETIETKE